MVVLLDEETDLTIGANIAANGGEGTTTGGTGGSITASHNMTGAIIVVNPGVTLRANGGAPTAANAGTITVN